MNVGPALRRALHECADLIADAMEKDAESAAGPTATPATIGPRSRERVPRIPRVRVPDATPEERKRAQVLLRRAGLL